MTHHTDIEIENGSLLKEGGAPICIGDTIEVDGEAWTVVHEPKVENYAGHQIKVWAFELPGGWRSVAEILTPTERRDH